jgi:hypothetical protein
VVEVDPEPELLECAVYVVVGEDGRQSAPFPWARVGSAALARVARRTRLVVVDAWTADTRQFVVLRPDGSVRAL